MGLGISQGEGEKKEREENIEDLEAVEKIG